MESSVWNNKVADMGTKVPRESSLQYKKKKRGRRFLQNAKGFAKQGIYGRGTHIDADQYAYFLQILDTIYEQCEDVEVKVIKANNTFEQTKNQETFLASNQVVSKLLEALMGFVDAEHLERFFDAFSENFRPLCSNAFASHVLQKMIAVALLRSMGKENIVSNDESKEASTKKRKLACSEEKFNLEAEFSAEHREKCKEFVERTGYFLLNNLEEFVWDTNASHVMRTSLLCLSGIFIAKVPFKKGTQEVLEHKTIFEVPEQWLKIMKEYPERLAMWPQFAELPYNNPTSNLLGSICIALHVVDKKALRILGKKILRKAFLVDSDDVNEDEVKDPSDDESEGKKCEDAKQLPKVFHTQCSVFLLETLINVAGPNMLNQLYAQLFCGRSANLAKNRLTNFSVQKLLQNIRKQDDLQSIFAELIDEFEEILRIGHTAVIAMLAGACLRLRTKQVQFIIALQKALHVAADNSDKNKIQHIFVCLTKLKTYELVKDDDSSFVHMHGSLIVQHILNFNKPIFVVNSILNTPPRQLVAIFSHHYGSHIVDAFVESKFIGEKSKEKLIHKLEGNYVEMAICKSGSYTVEALFRAASDVSKERIAKELGDNHNLLNSTAFGRILDSKLRIATYRLSASQWKSGLNKNENKAEKLFSTITK